MKNGTALINLALGRRHQNTICVHSSQTIPRALWKLGRSQPERSMKLLSTLQQAIRLAPGGNSTQFAAVFADIHQQMLVLWGMLLPASTKKQKKKESSENDEAPIPKKFVTGPLAALPLEAQVCIK